MLDVGERALVRDRLQLPRAFLHAAGRADRDDDGRPVSQLADVDADRRVAGVAQRVADMVTHRRRVQGRVEDLPVSRGEAGQVQVQATRPVVPDLHRREVAVAAERESAQLFRGRVTAIDLDARSHRRQAPSGNGWPPMSAWRLATSHARAWCRASSVLYRGA